MNDPKETLGIVNAMSSNPNYFCSIRSQFGRRGKTDCLLALVTQGSEVLFDALFYPMESTILLAPPATSKPLRLRCDEVGDFGLAG
jgi:hypothetical protein